MLRETHQLEEPIEAEQKHYELLAPIGLTAKMQKQIHDLGIHLIERTENTKLENTNDPDLINLLASTYLVCATQEQAKRAKELPFVYNMELHKPFYPREKILSILETNLELSIEFFCTISFMLKQPLKDYVNSANKTSFYGPQGLHDLGIFAISANKPADIEKIDKIAEMEGVRSVEYSSHPVLL